MNQQDTIIIAAGGTGGHLYPGIALGRELKKRGKDVAFVVRRKDACVEILEKEGFAYHMIPVAGMPRKLSLKFFSFFFLLVKSFFAARALIKSVRPIAVVGMGGYISFPVAVTARLAGIPVVIHEQNYIPGLANRLLFRIADRVAVSFEDSLRYFPKGKTVVTGNPVREELFRQPIGDVYRQFDLAPGRFTILVFGGSQGASVINTALVGTFPLLTAVKDALQFLHITGKKDILAMEKAYEACGIKGCVLPYLHTIGDAYAAADLIICRAGATTVAELVLLNKPAILVPYLHATANHQEFNAAVLVRSGRGVMLREKELLPEKLADILTTQLAAFKGHVPSAATLPAILPQQALCELVLHAKLKIKD